MAPGPRGMARAIGRRHPAQPPTGGFPWGRASGHDRRDVKHVDFRHNEHSRRDFGHSRGKPDFDRHSHDRRDFGHSRGHHGRSMEVKADTKVKADAKVASK